MKNKIIIIIAILILAAFAVIFWYYQRNIVTKADVRLEIRAPETVAFAQNIEYTVVYQNVSEFRLEDLVLIFRFPEHSVVEGERPLIIEKRLDDLNPKQEKNIRFPARLFGREGEFKEANASLSYRLSNTDSHYDVETSHVAQITSVPLVLSFDLPEKIEAEKEFTFRVSYFSDVNYPLSNLGIQVEYPEGFKFKSASPQPLEEPYWDIGILNRGKRDSITVTGEIEGEAGEQKTFEARLGFWHDDRFVLLKETSWRAELVKPSLYISQEINRNPHYIASPEDLLHYQISFRNIGREPLSDLSMIVELEGEAFDFSTIKVPAGRFYPTSQSIIFDSNNLPELKFLDSLEEGRVDFWVKLGPQEKNAMIKSRVYLGAATDKIETKINSKLDIEQAVDRRTVTWSLKNHYNDVKNIKVRGVLAEGLSLTGSTIPEEAVLLFDSLSREVVWSIEELAAGQEVFISFGISERLAKPFNTIKVSGEDLWTERTIKTTLEIDTEDDYEG